jgi:ankyrin repeat protein
MPERMDSERVRTISSQFHSIKVQKLCAASGDERGTKGEMTPLMEAAYNGHTDIVTLLIGNTKYFLNLRG